MFDSSLCMGVLHCFHCCLNSGRIRRNVKGREGSMVYRKY